MHNVVSDTITFIKGIRHPFLLVIAIGLIIRLILLPLTFNMDSYYWTVVVDILNSNNGLYDTCGYSYTPIWGYFLSIVSFFGSFLGVTNYSSIVPTFIPYINSDATTEFITTFEFNTMLKISLIIIDVIVAFLIYHLLQDVLNDKIKAATGSALWFLCPITIMESSIHGMFDNISALFLVLTFIFVYGRKYFASGFVFAFAILTKYFPIFFIFILIAIIMKREGFDNNGFKKISISASGFIIGLILNYIPILITGKFWDSIWFITTRLDIETETLNSIIPFPLLIALVIIVMCIIAATIFIFRNKIKEKITSFNDLSPKTRDKLMIKISMVLIILTAVFVGSFTVYSMMSTGLEVNNSMGGLSMRGIMFITLVSVIIQLFIAYRYIYCNKEGLKPAITALMLTACTIFLWPPTPQYVIVIVPILAIFVVTVDRSFIKPFLLFGTMMMLYQLTLGNISMLYTIGSYTNLIGSDILVGLLDFFHGTSVIIPTAIKMIVGPLSYLTIIYIIYYWLKKNNWGRINEGDQT